MSPTSSDPLFGNAASDLLRDTAGTDRQPPSDPRFWEPPSPEELQARLDGYLIEAFLARGGMGAVYRGMQTSLERAVAIKILPQQLSQHDASFAQRFKQEARAMAQLNHPGIVKVYDFGEMSDGALYFIMEYIEGTDVAKLVASQGRLSSAHAMAITAHVCDALQYAHQLGIIHRDIKPANIMVGTDGAVKVADFGLAKSFNSAHTTLTMTGHVMGTLHFVAPEALMLGSAVDHRADIYAVGVMLYQMLTGRLPQGMFEMPSLLVPGLDPRYDAIIAYAMRENRDHRYQTIYDMRYALDCIATQPVVQVSALPQVTAPQQTAAAPVTPQAIARLGPPVQRPAQPRPATAQRAPAPAKRKSPWVAIAAVLALAAAGGSYFWHQSTRSPSFPAATKEKPFVNSLGMQFIPVPETDVLMCIHETRNQDFAAFAASNPMTQTLWNNIIYPGTQGKPENRDNDHPVRSISWYDAEAFCDWLSRKEGRSYRLPTDREWCLAAGISTDPNANEPIDSEKNPSSTEDTSFSHVLRSKPNKQGFYSLLGGELMQDWFPRADGFHDLKVSRTISDGKIRQGGEPAYIHRLFSEFRVVLGPAPLPTSKTNPVKRSEGVTTYDPSSLKIVESMNGQRWMLTDGKVDLHLFYKEQAARQALAMAVEHTQRHIVGVGCSFYSFEYWTGSSGIKGGDKTSDILTYDASTLSIAKSAVRQEMANLQFWAIQHVRDGKTEVLQYLDSEARAKAALEIAKRCTRKCTITWAGPEPLVYFE